MKKSLVLLSLASAALVAPASASAKPAAKAAVHGQRSTLPPETPAQKAARMKWWKDARFGLFLHWGLYAVPAGEWNGKTGYGEWILEEAHIPVAVYEKFESQFDPVKFDAEKWVTMAKNAGMKYIVITSKHHEGFNMFDSKYSDYSIAHTPFHRDPMKELAAACRRHGLKLCFYHSIMDWHHPDYLPRRSWEDRPVDGADFRRYVQYLRNEVTQLLTDYGPIGVMWFDGEWESTWNHKDGQALYDLCRTLQPNVIVNNRVDVGRNGIEGESTVSQTAGDYDTPEQTIPATGLPGYWETCMTMNDHWGYNKNDHDYKSSRDLIRKLVDISSKGGNFLLNIGPTAEGEFPPEAQERLKDLGAWTKTNAEAIYGTGRNPFPVLDWGRCTVGEKGGHKVLYFGVFDWPADGKLVVPGIGNRPIRAYLLSDRRHSLPVSRNESNIVVDVPAQAPDPNCSEVAVEIEGEPRVYRAPTIDAPTSLIVRPVSVTLSAGSPDLEVRYTIDGSTPTAGASLYSGPFVVSDAAVVKARTFDHGVPVSDVTEMRFTRATPNPAVDATDVAPGLKLEVYNGDWEQVPDFDRLTPAETGVLDSVGIDRWPAREHFGLRASGYLDVPADGVYAFALTSDDGSKLLIDGQTVVDNDGLHSTATKTGSVALAKGRHAITLEYFNATGGLDLDLRWAPVGKAFEAVNANALAH